TVTVGHRSVNLQPFLLSLGISSELIPDVIARINLGQEVEFQDSKGTPSVLQHDPKTSRIAIRTTNPVPPVAQTKTSPATCPICRTALKPSAGDEPHQTCPICGHVIPLP